MIGTSRPPGMTINMFRINIGVSSKSSWVIFFYCSKDCISKKLMPKRFRTTFSTFELITIRSYLSLLPCLQQSPRVRKVISASNLSVISSMGTMNIRPTKVSMKKACSFLQ